MLLKYQGKEHQIKIGDLCEPTVGGLKEAVKKDIIQCPSLSNSKILLFHKRAKLSAPDDTPLSDSSVEINNDSMIFILLPAESNKQAAASANQSQGQAAPSQNRTPSGTSGSMPYCGTPMSGGMPPYGASPNMMGGMPNNMMGGMPMQNMGGMDLGNIDNKMIEQAMSNPEMLNAALDMVVANASPEQKNMTKSMVENLKNNPEALKQMMEKLMHFGPGMGMGAGMGGGGFNPNMMMMNPYMMQQQQGSFGPQAQNQPTPPNGPCSHGFYPLVEENGKMEPQKAEKVYADKIGSLVEMGFTDREANIKALIETRGNVSEAIDILTKCSK